MELERRLARQESLSEAERQRLHILQQKSERDKELGITYSPVPQGKAGSGLPSPNQSDEFVRGNTFKKLTKIKCMC